MRDSDVTAGPVMVSESFEARSSAVPAARRFAAGAWRGLCLDIGLDTEGAEPDGDVQLVVSELATNAVLHARSAFSVTVSCDGHVVRIAVADSDPARPAPVDPDGTRVGGRGLRLVELLAERWGVDDLDGGKSVWVEFRVG